MTPSEQMIHEAGEVDNTEVYEIEVSVKINELETKRKLRFLRVETTPEMIADRVSEMAYEITESVIKIIE